MNEMQASIVPIIFPDAPFAAENVDLFGSAFYTINAEHRRTLEMINFRGQSFVNLITSVIS